MNLVRLQAAQIDAAIRRCDAAFENPVAQRAVYPALLNKLQTYACVYAAVEKDKILGYCALYANDLQTRTAYLTLLAVRPDRQGSGVGKTLLRQAEEAARAQGMTALRLEVSKDNAAAQGLYRRAGFLPTGEEHAASIHMAKPL